jgi:hypothetical protein
MWAKVIHKDKAGNIVHEYTYPETELLGCYYSIEVNGRIVVQLKKEFKPADNNTLEKVALETRGSSLEVQLYVGESLFRGVIGRTEKYQIYDEVGVIVEYLIIQVTQNL